MMEKKLPDGRWDDFFEGSAKDFPGREQPKHQRRESLDGAQAQTESQGGVCIGQPHR